MIEANCIFAGEAYARCVEYSENLTTAYVVGQLGMCAGVVVATGLILYLGLRRFA